MKKAAIHARSNKARRTIVRLVLILTAVLFLPATVYSQSDELLLDKMPRTTADDRVETHRREARRHNYRPAVFGLQISYLHSGTAWMADGVNYNFDTSSAPGFSAGFVASLPFTIPWSLDTGASMSMFGFGYTYHAPDATGSCMMNFQRFAIQIPLAITFFEPTAVLPIHLQAGIVAGINIAENRSVVGNIDALLPAKCMNTLNFGLLFSIGYGNFSLRYIRDLPPAWNTRTRQVWYNYTGQQLTDQSSWGYYFTYTYWF